MLVRVDDMKGNFTMSKELYVIDPHVQGMKVVVYIFY
jgi:hypothetical protein